MRLAVLLAIGCVISALGCVGSPVHRTAHYNSVQGTIADNNRHLLELDVGMSQRDAMAVMGAPERSEGYAWGTAMLYRTAMTSGIYGTAEAASSGRSLLGKRGFGHVIVSNASLLGTWKLRL